MQPKKNGKIPYIPFLGNLYRLDVPYCKTEWSFYCADKMCAKHFRKYVNLKISLTFRHKKKVSV